jgi:hypothetical protein
MKLKDILIPTTIATEGMLVKDVFRECVRAQVPGIPYRGRNGELEGRISIRDTLKRSCLPEYMVELAYVLSDMLTCIEDAEAKAREVLCQVVDPYVIPKFYSIKPDSTLLRAIAIMEKNNCSYLFVANEGEYLGVVTRMAVVRWMIEVNENCPSDGVAQN